MEGAVDPVSFVFGHMIGNEGLSSFFLHFGIYLGIKKTVIGQIGGYLKLRFVGFATVIEDHGIAGPHEPVAVIELPVQRGQLGIHFRISFLQSPLIGVLVEAEFEQFLLLFIGCLSLSQFGTIVGQQANVVDK